MLNSFLRHLKDAADLTKQQTIAPNFTVFRDDRASSVFLFSPVAFSTRARRTKTTSARRCAPDDVSVINVSSYAGDQSSVRVVCVRPLS